MVLYTPIAIRFIQRRRYQRTLGRLGRTGIPSTVPRVASLRSIEFIKETAMTQLEKERTLAPGKVIYTAKIHTIGGRENGAARSSDGNLDVMLAVPGSSRVGTNPEQLFAAGWSACFESAIGLVAQKRRIKLSELTIDAEVDLHLANGEYSLSARFNVNLPGLDRDVARSLVEQAEQICPYSKVTRGNIDVAFNLV
jgi:Ohr subfamily peroxiredoxin